MLTIQAKKVAAGAAVSPFSASGCWVNGFMARHRMSVRAPTREGQQSPADLDNIATGLAAHVEEFVRHLGINRIYNADQTGISSNGQRTV